MTARVVTDEQVGQFARKTRELQDRFEKGVVNTAATLTGLQVLIEGHREIATNDDSSVAYRRISNLIVIGPEEWEKAFRTPEGGDPFNLGTGWCPRDIPVPWIPAQMATLAKLCKGRNWKTRIVLWLALPEVGGLPTTLTNQYKWFGVGHDGKGPGEIRQNVFWSNWFVGKNYVWADEPAVIEPTWMIGYELPEWTMNKNWQNQQNVAQEHGMSIATASRDALMLNLVLAATGKKLRLTTYARTTTVCGSSPLDVDSDDVGVFVRSHWNPGNVHDALGLTVEGVPVELGF